jgi:PAS domain S-box-containing protein
MAASNLVHVMNCTSLGGVNRRAPNLSTTQLGARGSRPRDGFFDRLGAGRFRTNGSATFKVCMPHADGSFRWINWSVRVFGDASSLYLDGHDVTELVRSERRFRRLLECTPDPSCVVASDGTMLLVNRTLELLSGFSRDELIGQSVEILVPEEFRARHPGHLARYIANPAVRPMGTGRTLSVQTKSGERIAVEISLGPMQDEVEKEIMVVCSLRPVDPSRRAVT